MKRVIKSADQLKTFGLVILVVLILGLLGLISFLGYAYSATPEAVKRPSTAHYHFRLQIIVGGKAENFAAPKYQEAYSKANCSAALTEHPIHFHDNKDQLVHIHWKGMTGGLVLKYYGWNKVGSPEGYLGYRFDNLPHLPKVPIHNYALPQIQSTDQFYVYTGDGNSYKHNDLNDFLNKDLEQFFARSSNLSSPTSISNIMSRLLPKAYAHGSTNDAHTEGPSTPVDSAELTRLNSLIGNVVIFVQKNTPSDAQVKERFNNLVPLSTSVCGG